MLLGPAIGPVKIEIHIKGARNHEKAIVKAGFNFLFNFVCRYPT